MALHKDLKRKRNFYSPGRTTPLVQESRLSPSKAEGSRPAMDALRANEAALIRLKDVHYEIPEEVVDENGTALAFEPEPVSPYFMALDGKEYDPEQDVYPTGMCPICNNRLASELDRAILAGVSDRRKWKSIPFPEWMIMRHLALHLVPVYSLAGSCLVRTLEDRHVEKRKMIGRRPLGAFAKDVQKAMKTRTRMIRNVAWEKVGEAQERIFALPPEREEPDIVRPSVRFAPARSQPKHWWAYDGGRQVGALRPWGEDKVADVVERKASEAIIFYDEMVETRSMAMRIYSEIMDSDIDALNAEREAQADGKPAKYIERNYGAALNAVKLRKDIATDMARLALIAQKYGDEREGKKPLSPALKQMLDDLGVGADDDAGFGDGQ